MSIYLGVSISLLYHYVISAYCGLMHFCSILSVMKIPSLSITDISSTPATQLPEIIYVLFLPSLMYLFQTNRKKLFITCGIVTLRRVNFPWRSNSSQLKIFHVHRSCSHIIWCRQTCCLLAVLALLSSYGYAFSSVTDTNVQFSIVLTDQCQFNIFITISFLLLFLIISATWRHSSHMLTYIRFRIHAAGLCLFGFFLESETRHIFQTNHLLLYYGCGFLIFKTDVPF